MIMHTKKGPYSNRIVRKCGMRIESIDHKETAFRTITIPLLRTQLLL
jgi:hypothetical protein